MPRLVVNGARLFYRRFGTSPDVPVILIHGATSDGATDWGPIAPVLGLRRRVIVPDCRGHGRSTNPEGGYTFSRLAADVAGLVRALGCERAHIVGHSNGGNVALVTTMEHPEVVASCVIQAGNAYVSRDLVEREPWIFDPERIEREDPAWRDEMTRLHGRWHGRDYWRTLAAMTVQEIVSAPAYTAADLARVTCPTLVIEGRDDRVNARSGHGMFIATHIPQAELWRPEGTGHAVHLERPVEWLAHVESFWDRRGDATRDRLWRLGSGPYADRRTTVFEVDPGSVAATGPVRVTVLEEAQATAARDAVSSAGRVAVRVLRRSARSGVIRAGVVDVVSEPRPGGERVTQVLFGEEAELLDTRAGFVRVRLAGDGYLGWVRAATPIEAGGPAEAATHVVSSSSAPVRAVPDGPPVGRLPFGSRLRVLDAAAGGLAIRGPGSGRLWIDAGEVRPLVERPSVAATLARFEAFIGVPYLWGGRTPWGFDCSGLAQAFCAELGVALPRDADQQWASGDPVGGERRAGDLLFFHDPGDPERLVSHVGIALDEATFLHASGAAAVVVRDDLDPSAAGAPGALARAYLGSRRVLPGSVARG